VGGWNLVEIINGASEKIGFQSRNVSVK
jgi:hypothetical protein